MTTIEQAIHALENNVGESRVEGALNILRSALAAPATAPEKTVKEIMEFVRHYAANTFSSATLEDKIRRSLTAPATAPEQQKPLVVMWAMYFRGYPEEPECKPAFMEDWRVYSDAASWDAEIDRANRNYQNHDNPTPGWLPYEARPVYVYAEAQPATAPAWHVAPTVPGLWLNSVFMKVEDVEQWHIDCQLHLECARWFGPIPPDGDKP